MGTDTYVLSAMHASEIARSVNMQANLEDQEGYSGYQMRRSPFVQRQMAKGKRFDK